MQLLERDLKIQRALEVLNSDSKASRDLKLQILQIKCRKSFHEFTKIIKPELKQNWFHKLLDDELDRFYRKLKNAERPKLIIQAPPRHGKSEKVSRLFPAWAFGMDPRIKIISTAYGADLAKAHGLDVQRVIDCRERYGAIFPGTDIPKRGKRDVSGARRNDEIFEIIDHLGAYRPAGVGGGITGMGGDILIVDDPLKSAAEADSRLNRTKISDWFSSDFSTRLSPVSGRIIVMTRWHEDDLVGHLIDKQPGSWRVVSFPAIAEKDEYQFFYEDGDWDYGDRKDRGEKPVSEAFLRPCGEALLPELFSADFLTQTFKDDNRTWSALYQQRPSLEDGGFFSAKDFKIIPAAPKVVAAVRRWDLAATAGGGDFTASVKMGVTAEGDFIVLDVQRFQESPTKVDAAIKNIASAEPNVMQIIPQDPGQAGKYQVSTIANILRGLPFKFVLERGSKEARARPFSSQVGAGRVYLVKAPWNSRFISELGEFPSGAYDDQVDAAAGAFEALASQKMRNKTEIIAEGMYYG